MRTRQIILDHDQVARAEATRLEDAGKLPPGFVAEHYQLSTVELREIRRLRACLEAAPNVDVFLALERGDAVPIGRLQPRVAAAHRRRRT